LAQRETDLGSGVAAMGLWIAAGGESTTSLIGNAVLLIADHQIFNSIAANNPNSSCPDRDVNR